MTSPPLMLVFRALFLGSVVFISLAITALQASLSRMAPSPTGRASQGRPVITEPFHNNPHTNTRTAISHELEDAEESWSESSVVSVAAGAQELSPITADPKASSDALITLKTKAEAVEAEEAKGFLERTPSFHASTVESVAPSSISSDGPLRHHLAADIKAGTDWKSLAEHALQERDMYKRLAQNTPQLSSFGTNDLVLDPTQKWTAPVHRPPACVVSKLNASKVCPTMDQSALIGTLLSSAEDTAVGCIMPKSDT